MTSLPSIRVPNWLSQSRHFPDVKPVVLLGLSTAVRLVAGFAVFKYLAVQFDPSAFGILTQVMGVAAVFYMFAGGGIGNGLIRNLAASTSDAEQQHWLSAAVFISTVSAVVLAAIACAAGLLGRGALLGDPGYGTAFFGIALAQVLVTIGNLALAYFSGTGRSQTFAAIQILANVLGTVLVLASAHAVGFIGAIFGVVFAPALSGAIALWFVFRVAREPFALVIDRDWAAIRTLLSYGAATACAVVAMPFAQLAIRLDLGTHLGWNAVGYWQAIAKLSDAYMLFIGTIFINYLLPKLSRRACGPAAFSVLVRFGRLLLPAFVIGAAIVYLARGPIITLIYSRQFLPATELVLPQLIGDTFRVAALLLHYYFMSRGRTLIVSASEVVQGGALYIFYRALVPSTGIVAPVYAQIATYGILLGLMLGLRLFERRRRE